jgi:RHO1 GDP-GTP exchange protein 1/2
VSKREVKIFLQRPVTRLPRLQLLLETIQRSSPPDHPDQELLPMIMGIIGEFVKSTQPGIEAAESKVKFWDLCETLEYQKGEIVVRFASAWGMDNYSASGIGSRPVRRK